MASPAQRLYGTDEAVEPARVLRAGPLTLELQRGRLRHIRCGGHEVWHGLAFVLRDADWGTPQALVEHIEIRSADDAFEVRIEGRFATPAPLPFRLHLGGSADGSIRFEAEAVTTADLELNRLGLCLLHPLQACGARVQVTHTDGRCSASTFPEQVPPWPPFMLVRALRHEWAPGRWAQATLEGDSFETEDQRNNADASFKTYSRSNMAPRPYRLGAGVALRQSALLRIERPQRLVRRPHEPLRVTPGADSGPWLAVGIEVHADDAREAALLPLLRELRPAQLHLAWRPGLGVHWPGMAAMLEAAGARLRLDALLPDAGDATAALQALKAELDAAALEPAAVAVFPSDPATIDAARRVLARVEVGGGTPHFFVQLSRLDALGAVDFASFTTASVVHGADDDEVMLGLASLPALVASWRAREPALPLRIGPSAIAARSSPLGAQPPSDGTRRIALAAVDPRSRAQFGAAWALGHVVGLAQHGVQALTLLSLRGAQGIVTLESGGGVTRHPAFHLLRQLGRPARRLSVQVSQPQRIAALALQRDGRPLVVIGNLGPEPAEVQVEGLAAASRQLALDASRDEAPAWRAAGTADRTLRLEPYAVALIEA
ncbi:MAG: hypothetical protein KGL43_03780 [Burkholderiales bacterium]|nr:hypothetical protein [Burkholderiales bacterium]